MRFSQTHKLCSYLMVLSSVAAVVLSGGLTPWTSAAVLAGIVFSWFAEPPRYQVSRYTTGWNIAALSVLAYLIVRVVQGGGVIIGGVSFLLFVLVNKLFNRRTSKDYQQAYVISFLLLVATTTLNTGLSYAVCFALYLLFATWSLVLLHLRREMEQNYLLKHSTEGRPSEKVELERILRSRRIVGPRFLFGTSFLSLGMLLGAALIFMLFPRIGFGLFAGPKRSGLAMVGFSDQVRLGHHGRIRNNQQVVMRVRFGEAARRLPPPLLLRWRGSAFDRYEAGGWRHSDDLVGRTAVVVPKDGLYLLNDAPGMVDAMTPQAAMQQALRQEIYLEPLDTSVIFAADRPVAVRLPPLEIGQQRPFVPRRGPLGEMRAAQRSAAGVHYIAYSWLSTPAAARLRAAGPVTDPDLERFLQLPPNLPQRVHDLARRIVAGKRSTYDKVRAVEAYLQRNYSYTLDLSHTPEKEPVDEFLFETRRGHCEYFASAMAILLRAAGVHSRHVNGFVGGQWNAYGKFLALRQADAHAWTEVLFSNVGWIAFDATPARSRVAPVVDGPLHRMQQLVDALRMRWFSYVVEYDLGRQIALVERMRTAFRGTGRAQGLLGLRGWLRLHWHFVGATGAMLLVLVGAALGYRRWRRRVAGGPAGIRARRRRQPHPAAVAYLRMLGLLEREKLRKAAHLTPAEFACELERQGHPAAALVEQITAAYYAERYGQRPADRGQLADLLALLRRRLQNS